MGFDEHSSPAATQAHLQIKADSRFRIFHIYDPNLISKGFCGKRAFMTSKSWPCRGKCRWANAWKLTKHCAPLSALCTEGKKSVGFLEDLSDFCFLFCSEKPSRRSCWRYSFRWRLEKALRSKGCMIQINEYDAQTARFTEGPGQEIETLMAEEIGLKIFRIEVSGVFGQRHIDALWRHIDSWINQGASSDDIETINFVDTV